MRSELTFVIRSKRKQSERPQNAAIDSKRSWLARQEIAGDEGEDEGESEDEDEDDDVGAEKSHEEHENTSETKITPIAMRYMRATSIAVEWRY